MPADLHTHNRLCHHAVGEPVEYARAARDLGLSAIGMADHNPMRKPFDDWRMDLADLPAYLEKVAAAREAVAPFPVRLGLECDYLEGGEEWIEALAAKAPWDYLIGSVHYLEAGWDFDNPKHLSRLDGGDIGEIWQRYWGLVLRCIRSGLFDILGHADLIKKFGHRPGGDLRRYYEPVIAALVETGMAFELNTAGLRKPVAEMYPARPFLELAAEADVPVVISSDAHAPGEVGADFAAATALLCEIGFAGTALFEGRCRSSEAFVP